MRTLFILLALSLAGCGEDTQTCQVDVGREKECSEGCCPIYGSKYDTTKGCVEESALLKCQSECAVVATSSCFLNPTTGEVMVTRSTNSTDFFEAWELCENSLWNEALAASPCAPNQN